MTNHPLLDNLRDLRRRVIIAGFGAGVGWALVGGWIVLLLAMWLDLVVEMPADLRLACGIGALAGGLMLLGRGVLAAVRRGFPLTLARRIDQTAGAAGQVLSGVDLLLRPAPHGAAMTAGLADLAVDRAAGILRQVPVRAAVPPRELWRPYLTFLAMILFIGAVALLAPRLVSTQALRFFDPFGDHPPFTWLTFRVEPGDAQVIYGGALDITVQAEGDDAEQVELVLLNAGSAEEALPMFPGEEGRWRATLTHLTVPGQYFVRSGRARSERFSLGIITVPKIEDLTVRITSPAYTNRGSYEGAVPQGGLSGLPGTAVEIRAKSNRPLSAGKIEFIAAPTATSRPSPIAIDMSPIATGAAEVVGTFMIEQPGRIAVAVTDVEGKSSVDPFNIAVSVLKDERPFVRITEPQQSSLATPDAMLNVIAQAEDDYGVSRLQLYRSLNHSRARAAEAEIPQPPPTRLPAEFPLNLADYGLQPGDVVKLYARVEDNDPAGAKGSESPVVTIQIISQEEMNRLLLAQQGMEALHSKYEQANRRLEALDKQMEELQKQLADELAKKGPDAEPSKRLQERMNQLAAEMQKQAEEIAKLANNQLPLDLDKQLSQDMKQMAQKLQEMAEQARKNFQPGMKVSGLSDKLAEMRKDLGQEKEQFEQQAIVPLEYMAKIVPLLEDEARYLALYEAQKDLAERMGSLRGKDGQDDPQLKARMRDMEEEQRLIREELARLLQDIKDHVAQLPEDPNVPQLDDLRKSALKFQKAVSESAAAAEMSGAENRLAEFAGSPAQQHAQTAAEILRSFIGECSGMGQQGQMCLKFGPSLSGMGNSVQQLLDSMNLGSGSIGGGVGGYSARSNTLQNIGLYGSLPTRSMPRSGQGGQDGRSAAGDGRGESEGGDPAAVGLHGELQASGEAQAAVPPQYKTQVGEYFQRVAEELEE